MDIPKDEIHQGEGDTKSMEREVLNSTFSTNKWSQIDLAEFPRSVDRFDI